MKPKMTMPMLASIGAMIMVGTLFLSFYISTSAYRTESAEIVLPSENDSALVADTPIQQVDDGISGVEITSDNVQQVIMSIARPSDYSFTVQNTVYFGQKSSAILRRQTVRNGVCRTDELSASGGILRSIIRSGNNIFAWQAGSSTYYKGTAGSFSDDEAGMIPTYETVVSLPKTTFSEVDVENIDYEPCIVVSAKDDDSYRSVYYISTVNGLLKRADIFEGERLIRQCKMTSISTVESDSSVFTLPNGTLVEGIKQTEGTN